MPWTTPTHVAGGDGLPSSQYDAQVVDNLLFLWTGFRLAVSTPSDMTQQVVPTANDAFVCPVIPEAQLTVPGLTYRSSTTAGNIDVGVYSDDGNGTTCTRLKSSGSVAMPAGASAHTINFTATQTLDPYVKYWLAVAFSSATARLLGTDGPYSLICKKMVTAFPLPATITFGATPAVSPCLVGFD